MPIYIGPKTLKLSKLKMPGDARARAERSESSGLRASLATHGQLQRILVRKSDMRIIAGADRASAMQASGATEILAEMWDATDEEMLAMRAAENAYRRHSQAERDKWLAELHDGIRKAAIAENADEALATEHATKTIAEATGMKPGTIERSVRRAKSAEKAAKPSSPSLPAGFDTYNVPVDPEFVASVSAVHAALDKADKALRAAQAALSEAIDTDADGIPSLKRIREECHEAAERVRDLLPKGVCVYCKTITDRCNVCGGRNWMTVEQHRAAPAELLDWANPKVVSGGRIVPAPSKSGSDEHDGGDDYGDLF